MKEKAVSIILPCDLIKKVKTEKPAETYLSAWWTKIINAGLEVLKNEK